MYVLYVHRKLILSLFSNLASLASIVGLAYSIAPSSRELTTREWGLAGLGLLFFVITVILEIKANSKMHSYHKDKTGKINDYMVNWIKNNGRIVILSRDLSWGDDAKVRELLAAKAIAGDLKIFIKQHNDLTRRLEKGGAEIIEYGTLGFDPKARFTIINYGQIGAQVAIGSKHGHCHIIEEFGVGDHPAYYMAHDIVEVLEKMPR